MQKVVHCKCVYHNKKKNNKYSTELIENIIVWLLLWVIVFLVIEMVLCKVQIHVWQIFKNPYVSDNYNLPLCTLCERKLRTFNTGFDSAYDFMERQKSQKENILLTVRARKLQQPMPVLTLRAHMCTASINLNVDTLTSLLSREVFRWVTYVQLGTPIKSFRISFAVRGCVCVCVSYMVIH